jgi:hypothetical protein
LAEPEVSEIHGDNPPFVAGTGFDLSSVGYVGTEHRLTGTTASFEPMSGGLAKGDRAEYSTRVLVYRPISDSLFNGTVWVEWLNVSGGLDAAPDWIFAHTEMIRDGAAWIGVSAQRIGVEGGENLLGTDSPGLVRTDPQRYASLHHPGDRYSYDIFTQVASLTRRGALLGDLHIERVIAVGESQSAFRLTTYANEIDPLVQAYDGFLIHARGKGAAPLGDDTMPSRAIGGDRVLFREDVRVPVLCLEAETDLIQLGYLESRQDDHDTLVTWEMAGTSHADIYTFIAGRSDTGRLPMDELAKLWRPRSEIFGMVVEKPVNAGPQHYVACAAARQLEHWVRGGQRPQESPRLETRNGHLVTDDLGIAKGGIRTPHVDVPVSVLSGLGNGGHPISFLCGTTVVFTPEQLAALYDSEGDYLQGFDAATQAAVDSRFVLQEDSQEISAIARINSPFVMSQ